MLSPNEIDGHLESQYDDRQSLADQIDDDYVAYCQWDKENEF